CSFCRPCDGPHRDLHPFPTRRSSDLLTTVLPAQVAGDLPHRRGGGEAGLVDVLELLHPAALEHQEHHADGDEDQQRGEPRAERPDRKSTRLNSSHVKISYAVFCLKKK